ncbi:MAG: VOC family protein [Pseudomonadales bacterium]|nr:VOC family protein [Pseudomonadales bacterium]
MTDSVTETPKTTDKNEAGQPHPKDVPLKKLHNIHHTAYRCRDAEQTRWFYEDVLGFKLAAAMVFDEEPGAAKKRDYMHLFFQMGDENFIAFFDVPDDVEEKMFIARHGFDQHIAFEVDTMEELKTWRRKINKAGRPCFGPIDHGFIHSIYMYDPNGIQVEITTRDRRYDEILTEDSANAHQMLADWTEKTRAVKEQRVGASALDLRGIDMGKIDMSKVKQEPPKPHHKPGEK